MTLEQVSRRVTDVARSRSFYTAALAAAATDNDAPDLRPNYHGAFVLDPDGNNAEAVCHFSEA